MDKSNTDFEEELDEIANGSLTMKELKAILLAHNQSLETAEQKGYARAANTYMLSGEKERTEAAVRAARIEELREVDKTCERTEIDGLYWYTEKRLAELQDKAVAGERTGEGE